MYFVSPFPIFAAYCDEGPPLMTKAQPQQVKTVPPLENPEEAPGGGTALTVVPTSEWEKYWQKIGGDIQQMPYYRRR